MLLTVTNLYPRPDQPVRGLFNAQLFDAIHTQMACGTERSPTDTTRIAHSMVNLVFVPEWRLWYWPRIRRWRKPAIGGPGSEVGTHYVPVLHVPLAGRSIAWWLHVQALKRYSELFAQADAVLATWLYPDAVAAGILARKHGTPFWIKVHGTDRFHLEHRKRSRIIRAVIPDAAGFLPNAQFLADYLAEQDVEEEKIHVIRHGVDHGRFHPRRRDKAWEQLSVISYQLSVKKDRQVVLYVGHLKPIKGPDRLLRAFASTVEHGAVSAELVLIGTGPMKKRLQDMARDLKIDEWVHFLGALPPDDVALWMNVAQCLCLPSRSEGMPNVVIEALASGCPVVATDVGDVKHIVREDTNGHIVANGEAAECELSTALTSTLSQQWDPGSISSTTTDFSWEHAAEQTVALIDGK